MKFESRFKEFKNMDSKNLFGLASLVSLFFMYWWDVKVLNMIWMFLAGLYSVKVGYRNGWDLALVRRDAQENAFPVLQTAARYAKSWWPLTLIWVAYLLPFSNQLLLFVCANVAVLAFKYCKKCNWSVSTMKTNMYVAINMAKSSYLMYRVIYHQKHPSIFSTTTHPSQKTERNMIKVVTPQQQQQQPKRQKLARPVISVPSSLDSSLDSSVSSSVSSSVNSSVNSSVSSSVNSSVLENNTSVKKRPTLARPTFMEINNKQIQNEKVNFACEGPDVEKMTEEEKKEYLAPYEKILENIKRKKMDGTLFDDWEDTTDIPDDDQATTNKEQAKIA